MFSDLGRTEGYPSQYGDNRTPVTCEIFDVVLIVGALILANAFFISTANPKAKENTYLYTRVTVSILIGFLILFGNYSQDWEVAQINTRTPYKAGSGVQINASIGLRIGLRGVNVTLKSDVDSNGPLKHETINYNERFYWTWDQGQAGFGPYAGTLQKEFRAAQYRGAPMPILRIMEYFIIDGGGFRYGRFYRIAGWFANICLWAAFPCWLLANIFFRTILRYGGYLLGLTGILQLTANLLWVMIRNPKPLAIPFEDGIITTKLGLSFWLTFCSGVFCLAISITIVISDIFFSNRLHYFFGVNPLKAVDFKYISDEENRRTAESNIRYTKDDEKALIQRERLNSGTLSVLRVKRNTNTILMRNQIRFTQNIAGPS